MIPVEAVEAAWDKLHENPIRPIGIAYAELEAALEAAAPYMLETGKGKGPIVVPVPRSAVTNLYRTRT